MNWLQILIGNRAVGKPDEATKRAAITDPFNFLLDQYLRHYKGDDGEIILRSTQ